MNHFGSKFAISIFGESHSQYVGVVIDGIPAGLSISTDDFVEDISRRASGAEGTTMRKENDNPNIVSGLFEGCATGSPMTIMFENNDIQPKDYSNLKNHPRPSHADLTAKVKYGGYNDYRGGGHFSGRLTVALVAAGVIAKKILKNKNIIISSELISIGTETNKDNFSSYIKQIVNQKDSIGGVIQCIVKGVNIGCGEPFFDSVESVISHIIFAIPGVKGIEFGNGFESSKQFGSQHNDIILSGMGECLTNNSGGVSGGISNGNDIVFNVAIKPTASISKPQATFNLATNNMQELVIGGRHDSCIALRAGVVVESSAAIALCNLILENKGV